MQVERSIVIDCPVSQVFSFVTDVENAVKWQSSTVETHLMSAGPIAVGATFTHVAKFLGRRIASSGRVYEYEPNRRFAYRGSNGSVSTDIRYRFEPVPEGARLTVVYGGEPGGFKVAEPLVARATARLLEGDLNKLKQVMEATLVRR